MLKIYLHHILYSVSCPSYFERLSLLIQGCHNFSIGKNYPFNRINSEKFIAETIVSNGSANFLIVSYLSLTGGSNNENYF